jgi:phage I-like protein
MKKLLIAACSLAISVTEDQKHLLLIPEGELNGLDGRKWTLSVADGQSLVAALNRQKIDMVIDYEHATLEAAKSGKGAPAAGWCKAGQFEYVVGVGVCSNAWSWTPVAKPLIENDEYRYLSPVFLYTKDGEVKTLLHAALTNTPNLDVMPEVLLAAASRQLSTNQEGDDVDDILEQLRWMLNLPLSATPVDVKAELEKLIEKISSTTGVAVAANSKNLFDALDAMELKIAANSQQAPDPSKFVPIAVVTSLQTQLAELTQAQAEVDHVEPLIQAALSDGRLNANNTEHVQWARDYGKADIEGLKKSLDAMPRIAALTRRQTQNSNLQQASNSRQDGGFDDDTVSVAAMFGHSVDYLKQHGA